MPVPDDAPAADRRPAAAATETPQVFRVARRNLALFLALGVLLILGGLASLAAPFVTTLATNVVVGTLFLVLGGFQVAQSFADRGWSGFALHLFGGVLYALAGLVLWLNPLAGALALTVVLAALFVADGALKLLSALRVRPARGWRWLLGSGLLSLVIGAALWAELPGSAAWAIGVLVGLALMMSGWTFIVLALAARTERVEPASREQPSPPADPAAVSR